jgi:uncharacterized protein (TIGR02246 family)
MAANNDVEEIRRLLAEYCFAIDNRDAEYWASLFTDDGVFDSNTLESLVGHKALRDFVNSVVPDGRHHFSTNEIIVVDGDVATVRAYAMVTMDSPPVLSSVGTYEDDLVRTASGWRFRRRYFDRH